MISTASKRIFPLAFAALLVAAGSARAYDEAEAAKLAEEIKKYRFETVTTKEGLKFSVPSDMPIETKDGIVAPVPFEEYLYFKFRKMEERMTVLENRLTDM